MKGMGVDEALFYQVEDERHSKRLRQVPGCVGLAQGILPSQVELSSGLVWFGGFSMAVGTEAMHLVRLKRVRHANLGTWPVDNFGHIFRQHHAAFLHFEFNMDRARSAESFVVGFSDKADFDLFCTKFSEHFGREVENYKA